MLNENEVSAAVVAWLKANGFADATMLTAGQTGIDIQCGPSDTHPGWIIEAKGAISSRPTPTSKPYGSGETFSAVSNAFTTAAWWRNHKSERGDRSVGIAIPSTHWFDVHSQRLEVACGDLGITIFRVSPSKEVAVFFPPGVQSPAD